MRVEDLFNDLFEDVCRSPFGGHHGVLHHNLKNEK
jgi:hypothetical protein